MRAQLVSRKTSGRDRDGARANRFAARDVVRCVADDVDVGRRKLHGMRLPSPFLRKRPKMITIVMIVGEGAKLEKIPDAVVRKFELRAATQIAGQESKNIFRTSLQARQQFSNAGQKPALALRQFNGEKFKIMLEEGGRVFLSHRHTLLAQDLVDDAGIGPACDFDPGEIVTHPKFVPKHRLERTDPGPAGIDQGAIDVEKEEAFCHCFPVAILTERTITDHFHSSRK